MIRWLKTLWFVVTLRCEDADRLRTIESRESIRLSDRIGERLHTALCGSCRRARRQMRKIDETLRTMGGTESPLPDEARERVVSGLAARLEQNKQKDSGR